MIRDITIGQYYSVNSPIHKLDARIKILGTLLYIISLFTFQKFAGYAAAITFFLIMVGISRVPLKFIVRGLKPIFFMLIFTGFLNLFWTPGTELFKIGVLSITIEGVQKMVFISLRLILLILGSSLMTLTTTPNQLTDGLEKLLKPLNAIHVPVHELAMMMSIALRFIPILVEETDKIMKAQMARGADFESGNIFQRVKSMVPILIPLFVSAIRRANDLALAMDARCYNGGKNRTRMYPLRFQKRDAVAVLCLLLYLIALYFLIRISPY